MRLLYVLILFLSLELSSSKVERTAKPSQDPTPEPTFLPTPDPSPEPTPVPTFTQNPSSIPSCSPTSPTGRPTSKPSCPTTKPTSTPSHGPTSQPSSVPSTPSSAPSGMPSNFPTVHPSKVPTSHPSSNPTNPTIYPTGSPTKQPLSRPTASPTNPTSAPTGQPSELPTSQPSSTPTSPTSQPSQRPSGQPTSVPTTSLPTANPTSFGLDVGGYSIYSLSNRSISILVNISNMNLGFADQYHNLGTGGDLNGGIAASQQFYYLTGTSGTGITDPSLAYYTTLTYDNPYAPPPLFGLAADLLHNQPYQLIDDNGTPLSGNGGYVTRIYAIDQNNAGSGSFQVKLSRPIKYTLNSAVFSGWNRIVVVNGDTGEAWNIYTVTGHVFLLCKALRRWQVSDGGISYGVAEFTYGREVTLVYANIYGLIERQYLNEDNHQLQILYDPGILGLGDISAFTVDYARNRWLFHYKGIGVFGNSSNGVFGFASASFMSGIPTSIPTSHPTSIPTTHGGLGTTVFAISTMKFANMTFFNVSTEIGDGIITSMAVANKGSPTVPTVLVVNGLKEAAKLQIPQPTTSRTSGYGVVSAFPLIPLVASDLLTGLLFALCDLNGKPVKPNGGFIYTVQEVSTVTGRLKNSTMVTLSIPIRVGWGSLIASGFNRLFFVDGDTMKAYNVFPKDGTVVYIGKVFPQWEVSEYGVGYGLVEFAELLTPQIVYGSIDGTIERQIASGLATTPEFPAGLVTLAVIPPKIAKITTFAVDTYNDRFYFIANAPTNCVVNCTDLVGSGPLGFEFHFPTSLPSSMPTSNPTVENGGLVMTFFAIGTLQNLGNATHTNAKALEVVDHIGDDSAGGICLSSNQVLLTGGTGTIILPKDDLDTRDPKLALLSHLPILGMVNDYRYEHIYIMADEFGNPITGAGGDIHSILRFDPVAAIQDPSNAIDLRHSVKLMSPIRVGGGSLILSGFNRIMVANGDNGKVYNIYPLDGEVKYIGKTLRRWTFSDNELSWGINEFSYLDEVSLVYGSINGIERQNIGPVTEIDVLLTGGALGLGDLSTFAVDWKKNRWYFHYKGIGQYGNFTSSLGYAPAIFDHHAPTSVPTGQPSSQPTSSDGVIAHVFSVASLYGTNMQRYNVTKYVGAIDHLGLAVSRSRIVVTGNNASLFLAKTLIQPTTTSPLPALATNIFDNTNYQLVDENYEPINGMGGWAYHLIQFNTNFTSNVTLSLKNCKTYSQTDCEPGPIRIGPNSLICSGYDRIVIADGSSAKAYNIFLVNGEVAYLGKVRRRWAIGPGELSYGFAEYAFGHKVSIAYGLPGGSIERQIIAENFDAAQDYDVIFSASYMGIGDITAATTDTLTGRWSFLYQSGSHGNYQTTLVVADALYNFYIPTGQPSMQPSSLPSQKPSTQPTTNPTNPTSQPTRRPTQQPTRQPSSQPSRQPVMRPTGQPSRQPTGQPSLQPSRIPSAQPSRQPVSRPTMQPSRQPSSQPSKQPFRRPTMQPSCLPTLQPTNVPSCQPSSQPSGQPTVRPSMQPSQTPSSQPTMQPSRQPTSQPSMQPSIHPSRQPSSQPTSQPSRQPVMRPTGQPSRQPTSQPTSQPSRQPTSQPSRQPSNQPTSQPSRQPTSQPTRQPINQPSRQPSRQPTSQPTRNPTRQPTVQPTQRPSIQPTMIPSNQPSSVPSMQPSRQPTSQPSRRPSLQPTRRPSCQPSSQPSRQPSVQPSSRPSRQPTAQPSMQPSIQPTSQPSSHPSIQPSSQPSMQPTSQPSMQPSRQPTSQPSRNPSRQPTMQPSRQPTGQPSRQPSSQPTKQPLNKPTSQPSIQPTSQPSRQPSGQPSRQPSRQPSQRPSRQPTQTPTTQPTSRPSLQPSSRPSRLPTGQPTSQPTLQPTNQPTIQPYQKPTQQPTRQPSSQPSQQPITYPSGQPSRQPTAQPVGRPSRQPTSQPSRQPSRQPTSQPSRQPTSQPSVQPTRQPTLQPSQHPSIQPTVQPTLQPSVQPTKQPITKPTSQPTRVPSQQPTRVPTRVPTAQPTRQPSSQPSSKPSRTPSDTPTRQPSRQPSSQPSKQPVSTPTRPPTSEPTGQPSNIPNVIPTVQPVGNPSGQPSRQPTQRPSKRPSNYPSSQPTRQPLCRPTKRPSQYPSTQPSSSPTRTPSSQPTRQPYGVPSSQPTKQPILRPTSRPTRQPVSRPSRQPSRQPSSRPSRTPSSQPTKQPLNRPTAQPSLQPFAQPTKQPLKQPTAQPSRQPFAQPTSQPSRQPFSRPSRQPSFQPSSRPSRQPSSQPTRQPSCQPSRIPSMQPTDIPSQQPSGQPSILPSCQPSMQPSSIPTTQPTQQPSSDPTMQPSVVPSSQPTQQPSSDPTMQPSIIPTMQPSSQPSTSPSSQPSIEPSSQPSLQPSFQPSMQPSKQPSGQPSIEPTMQPTAQPSRNPSGLPSCQPSVIPSSQPSGLPSIQPSSKPSNQPSMQPRMKPSQQPTSQPTRRPTGQPSTFPSSQPTSQPSRQPTGQPTSEPTRQPTSQPSCIPTVQPSVRPTRQPTGQPSKLPTSQPSRQPTCRPTGQPSIIPSRQPTRQPSCRPSRQPSSQPISRPSGQPSTCPTVQPSGQPSIHPSCQPSVQPTSQPTKQPTSQPTAQPSRQPTSQPSRQPSKRPTAQPTRIPSSQPTSQPSTQPTSQPTGQPASYPTNQPSRQPSSQPTKQPAAQPTSQPSRLPSTQPTGQPSRWPTTQPTRQPIKQPTSQPSRQPTVQPSWQPTQQPSVQPTRQPFRRPTGQPSRCPTAQPSRGPTRQPSSQPSRQPSCQPSADPTRQPTQQPTKGPTNQPSGLPSGQPTMSPSSQPSHCPVSHPTVQPSNQPSSKPSRAPSSLPTGQPSLQPFNRPTVQPSRQPTSQPSRQPSCQPTRQPSRQPSSRPSRYPSNQPTTQPSRQPFGRPTRRPSGQPSRQPSRQPSKCPSSMPSAEPTIRAEVVVVVSRLQLSQVMTGIDYAIFSPDSNSNSSAYNIAKRTLKDTMLAICNGTSFFDFEITYSALYGDAQKSEFYYEAMQAGEGRRRQRRLYQFTQKAIIGYYIDAIVLDDPVDLYNYMSSKIAASVSSGQFNKVLTQQAANNHFPALSNVTSFGSVNISYGGHSKISLTPKPTAVPTGQPSGSPTTKPTGHLGRVAFVTVPATVYGDTSKYQSGQGGFEIANNIFSFTLSEAPKQYLEVRPFINGSAIFSPQVQIVPNLFIYTPFSVSSALTGQFYITAPATYSAKISLSLNLTGPSWVEYFDTIPTPVSIISNNAIVNAPKFILAQFGNGGSNFNFTFNVKTNFGNISTNFWPCSLLFSFNSSSVATCTWLTNKIVQGNYGNFSAAGKRLIVPGSKIVLLAKKVQVACEPSMICSLNKFTPRTTVLMKAPSTQFPPSVVLNLVSSVGACDDVVVDASASVGNFGRPWTSIEWIVTSSDGSRAGKRSAQDVTQFLMNHSSITVSHPMTIPRTFFQVASYTFRLALSNFLGETSVAYATVSVVSNPYVPQVTIFGLAYPSVSVAQPLSLNGQVQSSSCSGAVSFMYQWVVTQNGEVVPDVNSTSRNPRNFIIPPYTLPPGLTYRFSLIVSSYIGSDGTNSSSGLLGKFSAYQDVFVAHGSVVAIIAGGSAKSTAIDQALVLDGSQSKDEDFSPSAPEGDRMLQFSWSCIIGTIGVDYGNICPFFISDPSANASTTSPILVVPPYSLTFNTTYLFSLIVISSDGRSGGASVEVIASQPGSVNVGISNVFYNANAYSKITLQGILVANFSVTASWSVAFSSAPFLGSPLTPPNRNFALDPKLSTAVFPLAFSPFTFQPGRIYTFQLSGCAQHPPLVCSFAQINIQMNPVPYGGYIMASPQNGTALSTTYAISSPNWVTGLSSYPLNYALFYQPVPGAPLLVVQPYSLSPSAFTLLPAGLESLKYRVGLSVVVTDANGCSANASSFARVYPNAGVDVDGLVRNALSTFQSTADSNVLNQAINLAAMTLNANDCSHLPSNCISLKRNPCGGYGPNVCGPCFDGYTGAYGPSNTPCNKKTTPVGTKCKSGATCVYGLCDGGYCAAPQKQCAIGAGGAVCSGQGTCTYIDSIGNEVMSCNVDETTCTPKCQCDTGYGGEICSLSTFDMAAADGSRTLLCQALEQTLELQDFSPHFLDTVISSLNAAFHATELKSAVGKQACARVLKYMARLVSVGYLKGTLPTTITYYAEVVSKFVNTTSNISLAIVDSSVSSLTKGLLKDMVGGEVPYIVLSGGMRLSVQSPYLNTLPNVTLSPPLLPAEALYGTTAPKLIFPGIGLQACGFEGDYAMLSIMQWNGNPYPQSAGSSIQSNVLRFSSTSLLAETIAVPIENVTAVSTTSPQSRSHNLPVLSSGDITANFGLSGNRITDRLPFNYTPAYFLTFPFSSPRAFNLTSISRHFYKFNLTYPQCNYFNGNSYVPCDSCSISWYTAYNVTFACFDISQLCPPLPVSALAKNDARDGSAAQAQYLKRLLSTGAEVKKNVATTSEAKSVFEYITTFAPNSESNVARYGAAEVPLHGYNPPYIPVITLNLKGGAAVLGTLAGMVVLACVGFVYFVRWDIQDWRHARYLRQDSNKKTLLQRKLIPFYLDIVFYPSKGSKLRTEILEKEAAAREAQLSQGSVNNPILASEKEDSISSSQSFSGPDSDEYSQVLLSEFFGEVFQPRRLQLKFGMDRDGRQGLLKNGNTLSRYLNTSLKYHTWTSYIYAYMGTFPRCLRWLGFVRHWLLIIFVVTNFFSAVYPSNGSCQKFTSRVTCTEKKSVLRAGASQCDWDPHVRVCSNPVPPLSPSYAVLYAMCCFIVIVPLEFLYGVLMEELACKVPDFKRGTNEDEHMVGVTVGDKGNYSPLAALFARNNFEDRALALTRGEVDAMSTASTNDFLSAEEEIRFILQRVKDYFSDDVESISGGGKGDMDPRKEAKMRAIVNRLGMAPHGAPSLLHRLFHFSTPYAALLRELYAHRNKAKEIRKELLTDVYDGYCDHKDTMLLQYFILEQVKISNAYPLLRHFFTYDSQILPHKINSSTWLFAWAIIVISTWGNVALVFQDWSKSTGASSKAFALTMIYVILQDTLLVQPMKAYLVNVLAIDGLRPQLRSIYRILHSLTMAYVQDRVDRHVDFRLVHHFSAACRVARMESTYRLPAACILRQVDDIDIEACRQFRHQHVGYLAFYFTEIPSVFSLIHPNLADPASAMLVVFTFAAFLVGQLQLYYISTYFIVVPYLGLMISAVYYYIILVPTLQRATMLRKVELDATRSWRTSRRTMAHTHWRIATRLVISRMLDKFARIMYDLFKPLLFHSRIERMGQFEHQLHMWKHMNLPTSHQGRVLTKLEQAEDEAFEDEMSEEAHLQVHLPREIIMLRMTNWGGRHGRDRTFRPQDPGTNVLERKVFKRDKLNDPFAEPAEDIVAYYNDVSTARSRRFRDSLETTDVFVALQRMLMPLAAVSVASLATLRSDEEYVMRHLEQPAVDDLLPVSELKSKLKTIWDVYYPGGHVLIESEKKEVMDNFKAWLRSGRDFRSQTSVKKVKFTDFCKWFIQLSKNIAASKVIQLAEQSQQQEAEKATAEAELRAAAAAAAAASQGAAQGRNSAGSADQDISTISYPVTESDAALSSAFTSAVAKSSAAPVQPPANWWFNLPGTSKSSTKGAKDKTPITAAAPSTVTPSNVVDNTEPVKDGDDLDGYQSDFSLERSDPDDYPDTQL